MHPHGPAKVPANWEPALFDAEANWDHLVLGALDILFNLQGSWEQGWVSPPSPSFSIYSFVPAETVCFFSSLPFSLILSICSPRWTWKITCPLLSADACHQIGQQISLGDTSCPLHPFARGKATQMTAKAEQPGAKSPSQHRVETHSWPWSQTLWESTFSSSTLGDLRSRGGDCRSPTKRDLSPHRERVPQPWGGPHQDHSCCVCSLGYSFSSPLFSPM